MHLHDTKANHIGRKIVRLRELKGINQKRFASMIGLSQQTLSRIEQSEAIDDEKLKLIADALKLSPDAIKNFNEEAVINNIQNNYDNSSSQVTYQQSPVDAIKELYELLLKSEREKNNLLQSLLDETRLKDKIQQ